MLRGFSGLEVELTALSPGWIFFLRLQELLQRHGGIHMSVFAPILVNHCRNEDHVWHEAGHYDGCLWPGYMEKEPQAKQDGSEQGGEGKNFIKVHMTACPVSQ